MDQAPQGLLEELLGVLTPLIILSIPVLRALSRLWSESKKPAPSNHNGEVRRALDLTSSYYDRIIIDQETRLTKAKNERDKASRDLSRCLQRVQALQRGEGGQK